jgi:hypothetical protein
VSLPAFIEGKWREWRSSLAQRRVLQQRGAIPELERSEWSRSLSEPDGFYLDCFRYFHSQLPTELTAHRHYFAHRKRGFGEDAFHTMWFLLFREFKPRTFLEIGVYRGQTISLIAFLARLMSVPCEVYGISPFTSAGDSVSEYPESIDYHDDTLKNFDFFKLLYPVLLKDFSNSSRARSLIAGRSWDVIYIDGNHDYEIAKADWEVCQANVRSGGLIVLDDSGLSSAFQPPPFASRGHPGPSRVAAEVPRERFQEILQVGHNRVFQKVVS